MLFLILGFISSKTIDDIYGVDIRFYKNNTKFEFRYDLGEDDLIVFVEANFKNDQAFYTQVCKGNNNTTPFNSPGFAYSLSLYNGTAS